jgi:hypothetical protein
MAPRPLVKRSRNVDELNFTYRSNGTATSAGSGISFGSPTAFVGYSKFGTTSSANNEPIQNLNLSTGVSPADSPLPMGTGTADCSVNELSVLSLPGNLVVETSADGCYYENSVRMEDVAEFDQIMNNGGNNNNDEASSRNSPEAIYKAASLSNTTASPDELSAVDIEGIEGCRKDVDLGSMVQGLYFDEKSLVANVGKEKCASSFTFQSPSFASPRSAFGKSLLCHEKLDSPTILGNSFRDFKTKLASPNFMGDIEPLRSSPIVPSNQSRCQALGDQKLLQKAETNLSGQVEMSNDSERDNPFEDENTFEQQSSEEQQNNANEDVDFSQFFELRQNSDPESEGRKWLEFKCSRLSEPVQTEVDMFSSGKPDGLVSPFEMERPSVLGLARPEALVSTGDFRIILTQSYLSRSLATRNQKKQLGAKRFGSLGEK